MDETQAVVELVEVDDLNEEEELDALSVLIGSIAGLGMAVVGYKLAEFATFKVKQLHYRSLGIEIQKGDYVFKTNAEDGSSGWMRISAKDGVIDYIPITTPVEEVKVEEPA